MKQPDKRMEQMLISALRYALPRKSYIMSDTEEFMIAYITKQKVSDWFLDQILRDIADEESQRHQFGESSLQHDWSKLKDIVNNYHLK